VLVVSSVLSASSEKSLSPSSPTARSLATGCDHNPHDLGPALIADTSHSCGRAANTSDRAREVFALRRLTEIGPGRVAELVTG
jgi:hypothetical protein